MIIDRLKNAGLYYGVSSSVKAAFEFLQKSDCEKLELGRHEIVGTNVYALVQKYETKPVDQGIWEAHRKYIDVQFIYAGKELIGYSNIEEMKVVKEYDQTGDYLLVEGEGSFFNVDAGFFVLFAPEDAHMPCLTAASPCEVKKVVVKVAID